METVNGSSLGGEDKGGPPPPSPLTGCYLLVVVGEPYSQEHKDIILQRIAKGLLSWDVNDCLVNLEKELSIITDQALEGEEARYGERLIQFASENLVTEILIHPAVSTLSQCVRNLLSSFTRHRHIIHAGYTFQGNGSWALQDGTFSYTDFSEAFQEIEVQRVIHAYENGISLHLHCSLEGEWTRLPKESFAKACKVRVNPTDVLTTGSPSILNFIKYLEPFLIPSTLENILESSDVVGNIRFSRPTLYVFPGGQGDAALFGINGFNMLLDGGYSRKACFWDFVRHLDRLDAVLMSRLNNSSVSGISSVLKRKKQGAVYPQIGHFFCNIQERKSLLSPDGDKDKDSLMISLLEEGQSLVQDLRQLNLSPQSCYRDNEPVILYHKVGHGTLNMYVLSPEKNSREVREFLQKWNQSDPKLFVGSKGGKEFTFPLQNLVSVCALLVWQPANPNDTITRILYPGSTPQKKILEGFDKLKNLECIKHPVCSEKSLAPVRKTKQDVIDKLTTKEKLNGEKKIENKIIQEDALKNGDLNGDVKEQKVKKSDSVESDKEKKAKKEEEGKKIEDVAKIVENGDKIKQKLKLSDSRSTKTRSESQQRKKPVHERKGPTTPKKILENKTNGDMKEKDKKPPSKPSPSATPAKSTKDANNRKVIESKRAPLKKEPVSKSTPTTEAKPKSERKPISRRPKTIKGPPSPVKKMTNGVQKPDSLTKRGKLDKEGTTDSSTVSTPSADQESILKKDISKLTPEEIQQLKERELEELKEEQEAVKEIEAVFRKGEDTREEAEPGVRKIKDISIDDKLEVEEYLIIEKEEIEHDSLDQETKEDEMQKLARDSEESEKQRKLSSEEKEIELVKAQKEVSPPKEDISPKVIAEPETKKAPVLSPEEKATPTTDKKEIAEEEIKEVVESHPEEKISATIESGATTTAPTLPEDERITLDEIKEDNGQIIEEKHVKEETKEKEVPIIQLPPKSQQDSQSKIPPVVGISLDKQKHIRDIVKTPDEVADLPVHEEADYHEFHADEKKSNEIDISKELSKDVKKPDEKTKESEPLLRDDKLETSETKKEELNMEKDEKEKNRESEIPSKTDKVQAIETKKEEFNMENTEKEKTKTSEPPSKDDKVEPIETKKEDLNMEKAEKEITKESKPPSKDDKVESTETKKEELNMEKVEKEKTKESEDDKIEVIETKKEELNMKKDEKEKEIVKQEPEQAVALDKHDQEDKPQQLTDTEAFLLKEKIHESIDDEWVVVTKETDRLTDDKEPIKTTADKKEDLKEALKDTTIVHAITEHELEKKEDLEDALRDKVVSDFIAKDLEQVKELDKKEVTESLIKEEKVASDLTAKEKKVESESDEDYEARKEDEIQEEIEQEKVDIKHLIEEADKKAFVEEEKQEKDKIETKISSLKEANDEVKDIDYKLQELKKTIGETVEEINVGEIKPDLTEIEEPTHVPLKEDLQEIEKIEDKLQELKHTAEDSSAQKEEIYIEKLIRSPEHAEEVTLSDSSPEEDQKQLLKELDIDKTELGRKSPAEREEDVKKIVVSVAEVLKSEAPLEELQGKLTFTQELRETHITTQDSPIVERDVVKMDDIPPIPEESALADEEGKEAEDKSKRKDLIADARELMAESSKVISGIKGKGEENETKGIKEDNDEDSGTVHRMLVTASSEDGGEEIEICPAGTITFSRSSESSGRSSPEPSQKTQSQKSSIVETASDTFSTIKQITEKDLDAKEDDVFEEKPSGFFEAMRETFETVKEAVMGTTTEDATKDKEPDQGSLTEEKPRGSIFDAVSEIGHEIKEGFEKVITEISEDLHTVEDIIMSSEKVEDDESNLAEKIADIKGEVSNGNADQSSYIDDRVVKKAEEIIIEKDTIKQMEEKDKSKEQKVDDKKIENGQIIQKDIGYKDDLVCDLHTSQDESKVATELDTKLPQIKKSANIKDQVNEKVTEVVSKVDKLDEKVIVSKEKVFEEAADIIKGTEKKAVSTFDEIVFNAKELENEAADLKNEEKVEKVLTKTKLLKDGTEKAISDLKTMQDDIIGESKVLVDDKSQKMEESSAPFDKTDEVVSPAKESQDKISEQKDKVVSKVQENVESSKLDQIKKFEEKVENKLFDDVKSLHDVEADAKDKITSQIDEVIKESVITVVGEIRQSEDKLTEAEENIEEKLSDGTKGLHELEYEINDVKDKMISQTDTTLESAKESVITVADQIKQIEEKEVKAEEKLLETLKDMHPIEEEQKKEITDIKGRVSPHIAGIIKPVKDAVVETIDNIKQTEDAILDNIIKTEANIEEHIDDKKRQIIDQSKQFEDKVEGKIIKAEEKLSDTIKDLQQMADEKKSDMTGIKTEFLSQVGASEVVKESAVAGTDEIKQTKDKVADKITKIEEQFSDDFKDVCKEIDEKKNQIADICATKIESTLESSIKPVEVAADQIKPIESNAEENTEEKISDSVKAIHEFGDEKKTEITDMKDKIISQIGTTAEAAKQLVETTVNQTNEIENKTDDILKDEEKIEEHISDTAKDLHELVNDKKSDSTEAKDKTISKIDSTIGHAKESIVATVDKTKQTEDKIEDKLSKVEDKISDDVKDLHEMGAELTTKISDTKDKIESQIKIAESINESKYQIEDKKVRAIEKLSDITKDLDGLEDIKDKVISQPVGTVETAKDVVITAIDQIKQMEDKVIKTEEQFSDSFKDSDDKSNKIEEIKDKVTSTFDSTIESAKKSVDDVIGHVKQFEKGIEDKLSKVEEKIVDELSTKAVIAVDNVKQLEEQAVNQLSKAGEDLEDKLFESSKDQQEIEEKKTEIADIKDETALKLNNIIESTKESVVGVVKQSEEKTLDKLIKSEDNSESRLPESDLKNIHKDGEKKSEITDIKDKIILQADGIVETVKESVVIADDQIKQSEEKTEDKLSKAEEKLVKGEEKLSDITKDIHHLKEEKEIEISDIKDKHLSQMGSNEEATKESVVVEIADKIKQIKDNEKIIKAEEKLVKSEKSIEEELSDSIKVLDRDEKKLEVTDIKDKAISQIGSIVEAAKVSVEAAVDETKQIVDRAEGKLIKSEEKIKEELTDIKEKITSTISNIADPAKTTLVSVEKNILDGVTNLSAELEKSIKSEDIITQDLTHLEEKIEKESKQTMDDLKKLTAQVEDGKLDGDLKPLLNETHKLQEEFKELENLLEKKIEAIKDVSEEKIEKHLDDLATSKPSSDPNLEQELTTAEKAEEFIEKSEKALGLIFSTIGDTAKSVLHDIIPAEVKCQETHDLKDNKHEAVSTDKTKETVSETETSSVKDKDVDECKIDQKVVEKEEKQIDQQVDHLKENIEYLAKLSEEVPFDKCKLVEEFKVDKKVIEKEETQIDQQLDHLSKSIEDLTKISEEILFGKCKPSDEFKVDKELIEKEEKQIYQQVDHLRISSEDLTKLSEDVPFDKCKAEKEFKVDKKVLAKEETQIDQQVDHLRRSIEDLTKLSEEVAFDKCKPGEELKVDKKIVEKEKTQIDQQVDHLRRSIEDLTKLSEEISFDKCKPSDEFKVDKELIEKGEKRIDQQVNHLKKSVEDLTKLSEQVSFDKCKPAEEFKVDKEVIEKEEKQIEQRVAHLQQSLEEVSDLAESIPFDTCHVTKDHPENDTYKDSKTKEDIPEGKVPIDSNKLADLSSPEKSVLQYDEKEKVDAEKEVAEDKLGYKDQDHSEKRDHEKEVATKESKTDVKKVESSLDGKKIDVIAKSDEKLSSKNEIVLDEKITPSQPDKSEQESMEKKSGAKNTLDLVISSEPKKLSISDVEISIKSDVISTKDASQTFLDNERGEIRDICDAKVYVRPIESSTQPSSSAIPTSPKTTQELSGKTTPPTVPVSPIGRDIKSPLSKPDGGLSEQTETDDDDLSTKSQVAHSQSDLDELDMKMDPMSMSFYGALPVEVQETVPATHLFEITQAKYRSAVFGEGESETKAEELDLMSASFIGELPSRPSEREEATHSSSPSYLYEMTKAKFTQPKEADVMSASFIGELPSTTDQNREQTDPMTTSVYFDDPIASWGKPLGLPSPAPPNNEKGTPKKEKKLPAYVTAKNKLNDDKKRAESPSKLKSKKINPVYVDLTYVPHHGNHYYSYVDFFKKVRARYYVFSGLEPSRQVYDALLEAKQTWEDKDLEVTIIPTYDTDILGYWIAENEELLSKFKIDLSPSASRCTINLQDHETSCSAYRLEF